MAKNALQIIPDDAPPSDNPLMQGARMPVAHEQMIQPLRLSMPGGDATTPSERFWDAFDAAHAKSGLDSVSHAKFHEHGPAEMEISHIQVDPNKRGQGIGNTLMGMITGLADEHGVTLHASPASDADASTGLDYGGLRNWYQAWGFDEPGGGDRLTRRPSRDD